jgi:hypothetical protein
MTPASALDLDLTDAWLLWRGRLFETPMRTCRNGRHVMAGHNLMRHVKDGKEYQRCRACALENQRVRIIERKKTLTTGQAA